MSYVYTRGPVALSDRMHTWKNDDGDTYSVLDLGAVEITFDSAEEARQVAARCLEIADAIDALAAERES
jgi:pyruvate/2-oxoacid:ferredoxin oxidoreductase alpha subunit